MMHRRKQADPHQKGPQPTTLDGPSRAAPRHRGGLEGIREPHWTDTICFGHLAEAEHLDTRRAPLQVRGEISTGFGSRGPGRGTQGIQGSRGAALAKHTGTAKHGSEWRGFRLAVAVRVTCSFRPAYPSVVYWMSILIYSRPQVKLAE